MLRLSLFLVLGLAAVALARPAQIAKRSPRALEKRDGIWVPKKRQLGQAYVYQPAAAQSYVYQPAAQDAYVYQPAAQDAYVYQPAAQDAYVYQPAIQEPYIYQPAQQPAQQSGGNILDAAGGIVKTVGDTASNVVGLPFDVAGKVIQGVGLDETPIGGVANAVLDIGSAIVKLPVQGLSLLAQAPLKAASSLLQGKE